MTAEAENQSDNDSNVASESNVMLRAFMRQGWIEYGVV